MLTKVLGRVDYLPTYQAMQAFTEARGADTPDELDPADPRAPHLDIYHWLTWMQDSLVQALAP